MPRTVQLVTYIVRVRERRAKEGFDLTKWPDEGGFCPVIEDCLAGINRNPIKYTASLKVFTYSSCEQDENIIFGQLGAGEYGRRAPIKNVEDGEVEHQMERDHSQEYRFYFQLRVLPENDFAILALQKIGRRGVKTILYDRLQSYFQINYPDYIVDMHPLAPRGYLRHILSNGIREIRFIKRSSTGDEFDRMYDGGWSGGLGKRKVSLEAPIGESIPMPPFYAVFWMVK